MKEKRFVDLANWRKRRMWYQCKNKVYRDKAECCDDRLFWSWDMFHYEDDDGKRIDVHLSWCDAKFPSLTCKNKVFLACFRTCQYTMMMDKWDEGYSQTVRSRISTPRERVDTCQQTLNTWLAEQAAHPTYTIHEGWELNYSYSHFILVDPVLDLPYITVNDVNQWIHRFTAMGEKAYRSEKPVPHDHLIFDENWCQILGTGLGNPLNC